MEDEYIIEPDDPDKDVMPLSSDALSNKSNKILHINQLLDVNTEIQMEKWLKTNVNRAKSKRINRDSETSTLERFYV